MAEDNMHKFACPNCAQHYEVEKDMVGEDFECVVCGWSGKIPSPPKIKVIKGPEIKVVKRRRGWGGKMSFPQRKVEGLEEIDGRRWREFKAVGTGLGVALLIFVGLGLISSAVRRDRTTATIVESIDCLLDFLKVPTERRAQSLAATLQECPGDVQEAVKNYLGVISKTSSDMISSSEKSEMAAGTVILGLLFGAASTDDPEGGMAVGLRLGELLYAETEEKARNKLRREIESAVSRLIDVVQKYHIDAKALEETLLYH